MVKLRMSEPWLYHGEPCCRGWFYTGDFDRSPEVAENLSKSGSGIKNHLFTYSPYHLNHISCRRYCH